MGLAAWSMAAAAGWLAVSWPPAIVAVGLLLALSSLLVFLGLRPPIELREKHLVVGTRAIPWQEIRRVDRAGWESPLFVRLTLSDGSRLRLVYPGDLDSANSLLRNIRRCARLALIEGKPYREFWGMALPAPQERRYLPSLRYRLLRPEDEAEVERLYQQLRTAGRIDTRSSTDET
jgi:hypothetical protein